jgi:hypothetical protein
MRARVISHGLFPRRYIDDDTAFNKLFANFHLLPRMPHLLAIDDLDLCLKTSIPAHICTGTKGAHPPASSPGLGCTYTRRTAALYARWPAMLE